MSKIQSLSLAAASLVIAVASVSFWVLSVHSHEAWTFKIFYDGLPEVSGLQIDDDTVYVTLEARKHDGKIIAIIDGETSVIVDGLQKPDGLTSSMGALVYTQEFGFSPVYEVVAGESVALFDANGAEGVDSTSNGDVYVIEDRPNGNLYKYQRATQMVTTLVTGLEKGEGVCVMDSGDVYYAENDQGVVYRIQNGIISSYLVDLIKPGFLYCDEQSDSIWITEDRGNFGRLLHATAADQVEVIATGLKSPQSIVIRPSGKLLLAEAGRGRILEFEQKLSPGNIDPIVR